MEMISEERLVIIPILIQIILYTIQYFIAAYTTSTASLCKAVSSPKRRLELELKNGLGPRTPAHNTVSCFGVK